MRCDVPFITSLQADALGDSIGFLHLGRLRAWGSPLFLKVTI